MTHIVVTWFYAAATIFAATMAAVVIGGAVEMVRIWRSK